MTDMSGLSRRRKRAAPFAFVAESFFHTLKTELTHYEDFQSRDEAQQAIFEYIEVFHNRQRKHSTNGYLSPFKYEQQLAEAA